MKNEQNKVTPVSVLICTRNRPEDLVLALPGVMAQDYLDYEVVLIDQSTNDESERIVKTQYANDTRLRYLRTPTVGLSIARNLALTEARHEICAFTDDDTQVPADWLSNIVTTYTTFPDTHVLFSPVHVPKDLQEKPGLQFPCLYFTDNRVLKHGEIFGMGANMSLRKSFWEKVGPFDAMLGPGTPMPGSDEHDWLYRCHLNGANIRLEPNNIILHRAFREFDQWMRLTRTYSYGDAAFAMKHLRCGDLGMLPKMGRSLFYIGARCLLRIVQRNPGWPYEYHYVRGYWSGLWGSLKFRVDKKARLFEYVPKSPPSDGNRKETKLTGNDAPAPQNAEKVSL